MHTRQKIREAICNRLREHDLLRNLYIARGRPVRDEEAPYANVMTGSERAERLTDQFEERRTITVYVHLYVKEGDESANELDNLSEITETLLSFDTTLGGIVENFEYSGADPDYESAAQQEMAKLTLQYDCVYIWQCSTAVNDFLTAGVQIDMASPRNDPQIPAEPDGQIDASAIIALPQ